MSLSKSSSASRSKKRAPSTQFDPAFFNPAIPIPNGVVANNVYCKQLCCHVQPHGAWLPAAPSELLHECDPLIPHG